jgi:hypothetical protein
LVKLGTDAEPAWSSEEDYARYVLELVANAGVLCSINGGWLKMDDFRDLDAFSFALVCAGIMLVAEPALHPAPPIQTSRPLNPCRSIRLRQT